jgi:hypothetical protein
VFPGLKLKNEVTFKSTLADIKQKYPSESQSDFGVAGMTVAGPYVVELKSGQTMKFQFFQGRLAAIEVTAETED